LPGYIDTVGKIVKGIADESSLAIETAPGRNVPI
jgi:hypothetical protein